MMRKHAPSACLLCGTKQSWNDLRSTEELIMDAGAVGTTSGGFFKLPPDHKALIEAALYKYEAWTTSAGVFAYCEDMQAAIHLATWSRIAYIIAKKFNCGQIFSDLIQYIREPDPRDKDRVILRIRTERLYSSLAKKNIGGGRVSGSLS